MFNQQDVAKSRRLYFELAEISQLKPKKVTKNRHSGMRHGHVSSFLPNRFGESG